jgi:hypothetical protein
MVAASSSAGGRQRRRVALLTAPVNCGDGWSNGTTGVASVKLRELFLGLPGFAGLSMSETAETIGTELATGVYRYFKSLAKENFPKLTTTEKLWLTVRSRGYA